MGQNAFFVKESEIWAPVSQAMKYSVKSINRAYVGPFGGVGMD